MRDGWLLTPGQVPYRAAYEAMHDLAARRAAGAVPDTLILLEHPPVYTAGRRTDRAHLLLTEEDAARSGAELHEVDRGGSVTFHGPGQLVGYPILHLGPAPDVVAYLRDVEEAVIRACADLGVRVGRSDGHTGVWSGSRKVCAIGVRVSRGVTLHGFALNCATDLAWFGAIVPCGLPDRGVTSLTELAGRPVTVEEALPVVRARFEEVFGLRLSPPTGVGAGALRASAPAPA
ncbi:MAG TPA: lipoyl(octanoyl) transferase LipB [Actinomycetota bacterium]|nr:lipoyl(octanoyl) transferase LipB [Actinomycetota bacterium]